ncbi:MAG: glycoside hydrolase family 130 protein [Ginsengibacter sp.]
MKVIKQDIKLYADPKAVITRFLQLPGKERTSDIIQRVNDLTDEEVASFLKEIRQEFSSRHRDLDSIFKDHFKIINDEYKNDLQDFSEEKKLSLGALFTKEYSIEAAALFNPSIVSHPDQNNLQKGFQKFILSLRATGEGHISSIVFKTGLVNDRGNVSFDESSGYFTVLQKNEDAIYSKQFLKERISSLRSGKMDQLDMLPDQFTAAKAFELINETSHESETIVREIFESNYELKSLPGISLNEKVIFPTAKSESMGMEDVRFVKFTDKEVSCYYGTYTAYDGHRIKTQLIETKDFDVFKIRTLSGNAVSDKGMALFPEKINGKYVMISRQGGEKISIMYSENLYEWNDYKTLMEPLYTWELVQLGNCGSPIKTSNGWLLLTHGVGAVRTYVISAILLDLNDPTIIIGRLSKPLIKADEFERDGYVPNVVYTCGFVKHENLLIIPYAVSDSATAFATVELNILLNELLQTN